jgi:hypothetical protein
LPHMDAPAMEYGESDLGLEQSYVVCCMND